MCLDWICAANKWLSYSSIDFHCIKRAPHVVQSGTADPVQILWIYRQYLNKILSQWRNSATSPNFGQMILTYRMIYGKIKKNPVNCPRGEMRRWKQAFWKSSPILKKCSENMKMITTKVNAWTGPYNTNMSRKKIW